MNVWFLGLTLRGPGNVRDGLSLEPLRKSLMRLGGGGRFVLLVAGFDVRSRTSRDMPSATTVEMTLSA